MENCLAVLAKCHWYIQPVCGVHMYSQLCPTLCDSMDYRSSLPGACVHAIFQARILEQVAPSFCRDLPDPGIEPMYLASPALASGYFTTWEALNLFYKTQKDSQKMNLPLPKGKVQFSSVTQSCPALCDPTDCRLPGLPDHHQLPEFTQTHAHWVGDAIQPSHPLSSPSPPAFNLCQHQGLFQWVSSSRQVAKVLEFQLQHQSFQWIFRTDFL